MWIKKIYKVLDKICEPIACTCLAAVVVLTFANVILRYVFSEPIGWTEEVSALLYTFMVFFGLSVTHKQGSAVGVDIIVSLMPAGARKVMDFASTVLTLILWIILVVLGYMLASSATSTFTPYLRFPYKVIYWFYPISGFFCVVQLIFRLTQIIQGKANKQEESVD